MTDNYWHTPSAAIPAPTPRSPIRARIINPYEREEIPPFCHTVRLPNIRVPQALDEVFPRWCVHQPVGIFAPTGQGKTTFVRSIVQYCQHCKEGNTAVLYLCHRRIIGGQQKRALCKGLGSKWSAVQDPKAFELTSTFEDIGLTIMSYQRFAAQYREMDLSKFGWVILDEAHFFYSDALFNLFSDDLLEHIPVLFQHARRIYMSATPGAVLPEICRVEEQVSMRYCGPHCRCFRDGCGQMLCYRFPNHFDHITLSCFHDRREIVELVTAHPNEKFLIFTAARETSDCSPGGSYMSLLNDAGVNAAYLDRFSKTSDTWQSLCANECFDAQVLVCTSVLDCGVNIHDDALKHIVIEAADKTQFLQSLGRKRCAEGERIHVYVRALSSAALSFCLQETSRWLHIANMALNAKSDADFARIFRQGWYDESSGNPFPHLLQPRRNGRTEVKLTAYHALLRRQATLLRLLQDRAEYGDAALPMMALQWLEREPVLAAIHWLDAPRKDAAREELQQLLSSATGKHLTGDAWIDFSCKLQNLVGVFIQGAHDMSRDLGYRALNNRLKSLELPFFISVVGKDRYTVLAADESKEV